MAISSKAVIFTQCFVILCLILTIIHETNITTSQGQEHGPGPGEEAAHLTQEKEGSKEPPLRGHRGVSGGGAEITFILILCQKTDTDQLHTAALASGISRQFRQIAVMLKSLALFTRSINCVLCNCSKVTKESTPFPFIYYGLYVQAAIRTIKLKSVGLVTDRLTLMC